jgi:uncharacterized protein (TIGR03086 family)
VHLQHLLDPHRAVRAASSSAGVRPVRIGRITHRHRKAGGGEWVVLPTGGAAGMGGVPDAGRARIDDHRPMTDWHREVATLLEHGRDREAAALAVRHLSDPSRGGAPMDPLAQLDLLGPVLGGVVAGIRPDQLDAPTPCAGFAVRDVLEHMIGGATTFTAAFRGEPAPAAEAATGDPLERFGPALGELVAAIGSPGALDRSVEAPFGEVAGDAFARFVVLDGLIHGWDLATATGQPYDPPAALVAEVDAFARDAIVPAMREAEMFAAPAPTPADATPIEQLAAFTGRRVEGSTS